MTKKIDPADTAKEAIKAATNAEGEQRDGNGNLIVALSDGKEAVIFPGRGEHAMEAQKIMDGDESLYFTAMMMQLVEIDGNGLTLEEFKQMPLKDYQKIYLAFLGENFM